MTDTNTREYTKPKIEIVRQADGRDLILYDGIVVGQVVVERDEERSDVPAKIGSGRERRIALRVQAVRYGDPMGSGNVLDASIGGRGDHRFDTEADYDAWINADLPEEA